MNAKITNDNSKLGVLFVRFIKLALYLLPLIAYFYLNSKHFFPDAINYIALHIGLPSGAVLKPTWGDLFVISSVLLFTIGLLIPKYIIESHRGVLMGITMILISIATFVALFIFPQFGNQLYFMLSLLFLISTVDWLIFVIFKAVQGRSIEN